MVDGHPEHHDGRDQTIHYIDADHPERNPFRAIRQVRVDRTGASSYAIPDVVLFVNGIPLVVECKSPTCTHPVASGIEELLPYSNQRPGVAETEGVPRLVNQTRS